MITDSFPSTNLRLCDALRRGALYRGWNKTSIFNPNKIEEINFSPGRHQINPIGEVCYSEPEVKLLHYKYLGMDYLTTRYAELRPRLKKLDHLKDYGWEYSWNRETIFVNFKNVLNHAIDVITD